MRKKASILVLTGAVTISNIGLTTTSFAEIKDENLLTQEINVDLQNEEFIVSEIDEQVEINEDIVDENILTKEISTKVQNKVVIEQDGTARVAGEDGQIGTADDILVKPGKNGQAPDVDQFGNVTLPTGGQVIMPDGTIVTDNGNDHSIIVPGGTVITPNGNGGVPTVNPDGTVNVPEGSMVVLPNGDDVTPGSGSVVSPNGSVANQDGSIINPDGSITGGNTNKPGEDVNKPSEDTNKPGENVTKPSTNPNTGDRSVMGMLVVGSMALLALVKNLKIKDKLFLK